ncbi:MAG: hypothetical protein IPN73_13820 [Saprospiraceae bacterium]|nr:hypothetical protein [Saprospiraceae bacterium]
MHSVIEYRLGITKLPGRRHRHHPQKYEHPGQAEQARKVKRSESGMILDPVAFKPDLLWVKDAHHLMKIHKIGGIPLSTVKILW